MGGFLLGLLIGLVVGAAAVYFLVRRPAPAPEVSPASVAPEPSLAAPVAPEPPPAPPDDDVKQALDATKGLIDELEGRYRGRSAPAGGDEEPKPRRRSRRPPAAPPP